MKQKIKKLPIDGHYLLVGSVPLNLRMSKDIDILCYENQINTEYKKLDDYTAIFQFEGKKVECLLADKQESLQVLLKIYQYTTHELLYILKAGHIYHPHREWDKHIHDYHILKRILQENPNTNWEHVNKMVKLHRKTTNERVKLHKIKLKGVTKEEFFDDAVKKYYEHDFIHEIMAHKERPMYTYMQKNPELVQCERELWNKFTPQEKIWCVLEEAYVIALERRIIPKVKNNERPPRPMSAFVWALYRICTSLTSGWFRKFAVHNYYTILNSYDKEYDKKFFNNQKVKDYGKIKN